MAAKYKKKAVLHMLGLMAATILVSGCGVPASEVEKEIARANKQTATLERQLERERRKNPERFIEDGSYDKAGINDAIIHGDWLLARERYERFLAKGSELGEYPSELEVRLINILDQRVQVSALEDYRIYTLLTVINPETHEYLEKARALKSAIASEGKKALQSLRARYDKVEGITWYHHPNEPDGSGVYLYIGQTESGHPWLRLRGMYTSEYGWLFVDRAFAWSDGKKELLLPGPFKRRSTTRVWEW